MDLKRVGSPGKSKSIDFSVKKLKAIVDLNFESEELSLAALNAGGCSN